MLISGEKPDSLRDELLQMSTAICQQKFVVPFAQADSHVVWWGNTVDLNPGIGIVSYLDRPPQQVGVQAVKALFIAYESMGESSAMIDSTIGPDLYEDDDSILRLRDIFAQHILKSGYSLGGVAVAIKKGHTKPHDYLMSGMTLDTLHESEWGTSLAVVPEFSDRLDEQQTSLVLPPLYFPEQC